MDSPETQDSRMPRKYASKRRSAAQNETRHKIIEAVVELHAEKGVLGTTYADIARRADVAIPTVYNHFPTRGELVMSCTAHVAAGAPHFDVNIYEGTDSAEGRLRALVTAVFASHEYFSRWTHWEEAKQVPELQPQYEERDKHLSDMIRAACEPFQMQDQKSFVAVAAVLLSEPAWEELRLNRKLSQTRAVEMTARALSALFGEFGKQQ